ncbi:hypothetical protein Tco_1266864 [Tanacetum coccineum]
MISHEYHSPIKEKLRNLESRYIHEGRVGFNDFADLNYVRSLFSFVEFECLLEISDQICPRFILEFYSQFQLNYSDEGQMFVEFVIQNQFFSYSLEDFAQILDIPCEGACVFTDSWSLDELAYGVPSEGPYQTNPPSLDDIISFIRTDREVVYDRVMNPLTAQQERKTRKDRGMRRGRYSTYSSSSTFDQSSSSHLNDDDDGNEKGISVQASFPLIMYFVKLLNVPQVFSKPPTLTKRKPFYTCQTEIINRQVQIRDEHRGGLRSIEKGFWNLWTNLKKK